MSSTENIPTSVPMPQATFVPFKGRFLLPQDQREVLEGLLVEWREKKARKRSRRMIISSELELPTDQLKRLAKHGSDFLRVQVVTPEIIIPWDLASAEDFQEVVELISQWRQEAASKIVSLEPAVKHKENGRVFQQRQHVEMEADTEDHKGVENEKTLGTAP